MSIVSTSLLVGQDAVARYGVCCCPDATTMNQRWWVRTLVDDKVPYEERVVAECTHCGRNPRAEE